MKDSSILQLAIVDDGVNSFILSHLTHKIKNYIVLKGHIIRWLAETEITHGTICAGLIADTPHRIKIISIKVKDYYLDGNINDLVKSLNYCCKKNVDLINISVGSIDEADQQLLKKPVQRLVEKGVIIVAAVCNSGVITYPANLPGVFSVEHTHKNECIISYNAKSFAISIDFPHVKTLFCKEIFLQKCNSYYTALITKKIADIMLCKKTKNPNEIIKHLCMNELK